VWAIAEVVIICLNPMVTKCVMNLCKRHWLLSYVLATAINLIMAMEIELDPFVDGSETFY
jgi:hypothetical protein